ncbi:MAG TPA: hypothetical protein VKF60_15200 [Myxococcota bacterium]|nr:hypothetical protein [Myxococcota bacterium]
MLKSCLIAIAALALSTHLSSAASVRVEFGGTVDFSQADPQSPFLDYLGSLEPGTPFSGSLVFDDSLPNTQGGLFYLPVPPSSLEVTLGDLTWNAQGILQMLTVTTPGDEPPNVGVWGTLTFADYFDATFVIYLKDRSGHPLVSNDLADIPWDISLYPDREVSWIIRSAFLPGTVAVHGRITSLSAVREPGPALLLAAPALALLAARFRRARG